MSYDHEPDAERPDAPVNPETTALLMAAIEERIAARPHISRGYVRTECTSSLSDKSPAHVIIQHARLRADAFGESDRISLRALAAAGQELPPSPMVTSYCFYKTEHGPVLLKAFEGSVAPFGGRHTLPAAHPDNGVYNAPFRRLRGEVSAGVHTDPGIIVGEREAMDLLSLLQNATPSGWSEQRQMPPFLKRCMGFAGWVLDMCRNLPTTPNFPES